MSPAAFKAFQKHAASTAREVCGLVVDDAYIPCRNIAEAEDEFRIAPEDWLAAEMRGEIMAVCHSHPSDSCKPSGADIKGCEAVGLPYMILGVDGLWRLDPVEKSTLDSDNIVPFLRRWHGAGGGQ